jgi:hypothetical protein
MMALFLRRLRQVLPGEKIPVADFVKPLVKMIAGHPLGPSELLSLDDFSLAVLVESIATSDVRDETVKDLAKRIQSRDLFKQVPVSSDRLNRFLRTDQAHEGLVEAIKPFCSGDPTFYYRIDETQFRMMSPTDAERVCLVAADGTAQYASDHPAFETYRSAHSEELRLFTIHEAVVAAKACVEAS